MQIHAKTQFPEQTYFALKEQTPKKSLYLSSRRLCPFPSID